MLTRLIVDVYIWIIEIFLWFILLISGVAGYHNTVPMLNAAGWLLENEAAWKIFGALLSTLVAFLVLAIVIGPFLVLVDIRRSVRSVASKNSGHGIGVVSTGRSEPSL